MADNDLIYGMNPVLEAIRSGRAELVYISTSRKRNLSGVMDEAREKNVQTKMMHDQSFFDSRFPKGHQGIAASVKTRAPLTSVEDLLKQTNTGALGTGELGTGARGTGARGTGARLPLYIVLDQIEDPRNLGAILRTAEAAGAAGVITQERRSAGLSPEAVKASAGASEHIPLCVVSNIKNALKLLKSNGVTVVGAEATEDALEVWDADLTFPVALVIGSEGKGMRRTVLKACDMVVKLPLKGAVSSLNASVAAGAVIFEILRQNRGATDTGATGPF
jgi:23S rRNA (guanosine2251-2'-O)-methyltransferase